MGSVFVNDVIGAGLLVRSLMARRASDAQLNAIVKACRRISHPWLRRWLARVLKPWQSGAAAAVWRTRRIGWAKYRDDLRTSSLTTSLILKTPGPDGEKGVLYCSFEYNWLRLIAQCRAEKFLADYLLVGASSWSPPDYAAMLSVGGLSDDPIFIGVSNPSDNATYALVATRVRAVPILASDWINPDFYTPQPSAARDIDILMVANFSAFKRHWLLFEALSRMNRDLRVTLIGIPAPGRGERELRDEARALGVQQDLEILSNASIETVTSYQCRAKTSVILSLREGSCVAVAESLFAGAPVAMLRNAHIGSKAYITPETGVLVGERRLHHELSAFLDRRETFRPREWAIANISCHHASRRLNALLREYALQAGQPWTRDITPMCWRYVPSYVNPDDESGMASEVTRLRHDYAIDLEKFQYRAH
jgi:glycosyltransferase involved in cell wall biosynthesis